MLEVGQSPLERAEILRGELRLLRAAVHLERTDRGHEHRGLGIQARGATLDVEEFFGTEVRSEAGFGDDDVGQRERRARGNYGIAAVRDVTERTSVHECRATL